MRSPRIAVIEPHMDDAALSVGGRLLLLRGRAEIAVVTATRWSSNVRRRSVQARGASAVTQVRLEESRRAVAMLGAEHVSIDEPDAPLRVVPREKWEEDAVPPSLRAWSSFGPAPEEVSALAQKIGAALAPLGPDEIWMPLGVGRNLDHWRTRDACLRLLVDDPRFASAHVRIYADLPYANRDPAHARQLLGLLACAGASLRFVETDIGPVLADKRELLSRYPSQLDATRASAELRRVPEGLWDLDGRPRPLPGAEASPAWRRIGKLRRRVPEFLAGAAHRGKVTLLAPEGLGRAGAAVDVVRKAAPGAKVDVYAPAAEVRDLDGRAVSLHPIAGWSGVAARIADVGIATLLASRGFGAIRAALPLRPVLAARFAGEVCLALAAGAATSDGSERGR